MFLFLIGCRDHFDTPEEVDTFLDQITNQWWHLQDDGSNFYLERDGESDSGFLWVDFFHGPMCSIEYNVDAGEWQYEPNNKFEVYYDKFDFQLKISEHKDDPACWKISYGEFLYTDIACPYLGDCNTVY